MKTVIFVKKESYSTVSSATTSLQALVHEMDTIASFETQCVEAAKARIVHVSFPLCLTSISIFRWVHSANLSAGVITDK